MITDLLEMYFFEYAKKQNQEDEFLKEITDYAFQYGSKKRTLNIVKKAIEYLIQFTVRFQPSKSREISQKVADYYYDLGIYTEAYVLIY